MDETLFRYNPWWEKPYSPGLISRPAEMDRLMKNLENHQIVFLTGLRRIGKTSLLKMMILQLMDQQNIDPRKILYVSLDDYNLLNQNILGIVDGFRKIHGISFSENVFLFLDEVAYKEDFEIQLKNLVDSHNVKIFASSSSSSLLKRQKSLLTGRNVTLEILPLDFDEYLQFKKISISNSDQHLFEKHFEEYLKTGGIPEYVLTGDPAYLSELVDDIIVKDIAAANNIRNSSVLRDFFLLLMERSGKQVSLNKMASILGISVDTVSRYFEMFVQSFLIHPVARFGKTNERILSSKKIYASDTGIRNYFTGFRDVGSVFENYVYLRLKSWQPEYLYFDQTEIDFRLNNGLVVEAKYHDEPLSAKQEKLFSSYDEEKRWVVRNFRDVRELIRLLKNQ